MKYLIGHTQNRLKEITGSDLWATHHENAEIILTHPNLWGDNQWAFLREAAVNAGLITKERAADNLHLVEEAEAAARYCVSKYSAAFGGLKVGDCSLIPW